MLAALCMVAHLDPNHGAWEYTSSQHLARQIKPGMSEDEVTRLLGNGQPAGGVLIGSIELTFVSYNKHGIEVTFRRDITAATNGTPAQAIVIHAFGPEGQDKSAPVRRK
jgi:hypothetical protein